MLDFRHNSDISIHLVDVESGEARELTPHEGDDVFVPGPWASDGSGFYFTTDAGSEFHGLAFYDVGNAATSVAALTPYHDFGIGLRWLIPQLNSSVIRIDWAIATQDSPSGLTRAGLPGRVSAGFQQVF